MGKFLARKQHPNGSCQENSSDGAPKFSWLQSCRKLTGVHNPVKHALVKGKESVASFSKDNVTPLAGAVSVTSLDSAVSSEAEASLGAWPPEPMELDHPIRCPQPEPGIIHDGDCFRKSLRFPMKSSSELVFLTEKDLHSLMEIRQQFAKKQSIFPHASAPEPSISNLLDET